MKGNFFICQKNVSQKRCRICKWLSFSRSKSMGMTCRVVDGTLFRLKVFNTQNGDKKNICVLGNQPILSIFANVKKPRRLWMKGQFRAM